MDVMNVNANTYTLASSGSSASITLTPADTNTTSLILYNGGTTPVFVVSGKGSLTATLPNSATVPTQGAMVAPGATVNFSKNNQHNTISAISTSAGTGNLWVKCGSGG